MSWVHLGSLFEMSRGAKAHHELAQAYKAVFSSTEGQMVLADLANWTEFYQVCGENTPPQVLAEVNGKRSVFGRMLRFIDLTNAELEDLRQAARLEKITDNSQGEI